jgi:hypothetical protein
VIQLNGYCLDLGPAAPDPLLWWQSAAELAEAIVRTNVLWMRARGEPMPELDALEVRYQPSDAKLYAPKSAAKGAARGRRLWPVRYAPAVLDERCGNCFDLACYEAARLRLLGQAARVIIQFSADDGESGHAVVRLASNQILDPTLSLEHAS